MNKTRQIIEIDVTWTGWKKLKLKNVLVCLMNLADLDIERVTIREAKRKR
jgi:hypothetical protein